MKNGKVPGADDISADLLQAEKYLTFTTVSNFFCEIWISENMLEDWKTDLIVRLKKKGDLLDCNNWRSITLLSLTGKVFCKGKAGIRKGRSFSEDISTLRQILEQAKEWNCTVYANFIDF